MTQRLYYEDSRCTDFDATLVNAQRDGDSWRIELDRTCFYPEGGGQPADMGTIDGIPVSHVGKDGERILHSMPERPQGPHVHGVVDWGHRYDYMQQHTGQHVLSASLLQAGGLNTVSVHLGDDYSTIEVDRDEVSQDVLLQAEDLALEAIGRNTSVETFWVDRAELEAESLRRETSRTGKLRIVEIGGVDRVACGGVHVSRTGELVLVRLIRTEKIRGHVRTYWKIGRRAILDYRSKTSIVSRLVDDLSVPEEGVVERVEQLQGNIAELGKELSEIRKEMAVNAAERAAAGATNVGQRRVAVEQFHDREKDFLKQVAVTLLEEQGLFFCLTNRTGDRLQWVAGCGEGAELDFGTFKREVLPLIEGKGGGKPPLWQGVGNRVNGADEFLQAFRRLAGAHEAEG
jgi:alanyl-tRNA synthetase